jgi:preprotein translocase subunit SecA
MFEQYMRKNEKIAHKAFPQIKHVYETMSDQYKNIVFPLSDGRREVRMVIDLKDAYESEGKEITKSFEKNIILGMIDNEWKEHLREMDDLRSAVNNAQYEQKDPLLVYKLESFELFKAMLSRLNAEAIELLMKLDLPIVQEVESTNSEVTHQHNYDKAQLNQGSDSNTSSTSAPRFSGSDGYQQAIQNSMQQPEKSQPVVADPKIGRNDACPCGSGKKYKQCHGK